MEDTQVKRSCEFPTDYYKGGNLIAYNEERSGRNGLDVSRRVDRTWTFFRQPRANCILFEALFSFKEYRNLNSDRNLALQAWLSFLFLLGLWNVHWDSSSNISENILFLINTKQSFHRIWDFWEMLFFNYMLFMLFQLSRKSNASIWMCYQYSLC